MCRRLVIVAVASMLALAACGDDDDGGSFTFPAGQGTTQPQAGGPNAAAGAGYTQASHDNFVNECGNFPGASGDLCECAWGTITQTVPYDQYQVFETAFAQGSTELPDWLTGAVAGCS
jgi:hypothetical protein